jgi:hypothetical protein
MFRALLAHPQEVLHKRHLVYSVRVMSVGCETATVPQPTDITRTQYIAGLKRDGPRAETRFRLSKKRTSPFESAGVSA